MEFRILGTLEVLAEGEPLALGTLKERMVLATLLLHANEVVPRARLIEELWGASPPATATKAVNVYLSKVRKTLARQGDVRIATVTAGYRLEVEPEHLDTAHMKRLLAHARECAAAGELERAAELFQQALALWRGPTLADLPFESLGRGEVEQLDELRLAALMDRIDCDLALGRHEDVLGELQLLVREHPLQERLRGQQMLALYRAGRQADALDAYQRTRHVLVEELGIEPSTALQRLQQGILRHDPALETPSGTAATNGPAPTQPFRKQSAALDAWPAAVRRLRLHGRRRYLVAALAALVLAATLAVESTGAGEHRRVDPAAPQVVANSLVRLDPVTGKVASVVPVGIEPGPMAVTHGAVWTVNRGDRTVSRYSLRTRVTHSIGGVSTPYDIAADADGNVWVSGTKPIVTWILRSASGTGTSAVPLSTEDVAVPRPAAGGEAVGAGYLWVIPGAASRPSSSDRVSLIDVASHRLASSIRLHGATSTIAFGYGSAWIGTYDRRHTSAWLSVVRAGSDRADSIRIEKNDGWGPLDIAVGSGSVWVVTSAGELVRFDPETRRILARIPMATKEPEFVAVGDGSVWTANLNAFSVSQIDPRTDRVVRTIPLGSYTRIPCGIAVSPGAVWVAFGDSYCDGVNR